MKAVNNCPFVVLGIVLLCFFVGANSGKECAATKRLSTSKLVCYYSNLDDIDGCYCTHVILPANSDVKGIERAKERAKGVKVYLSVNEFNQGLINLLKSSKVDGLELNLRKLDSKNDIADFISTVKTKIGSDLDIALSVPAKADLVAKYFDFKALSKYADLFILQTAFLGASTNVTFHPSRLSGMWDMQNTDSVVDLVNGLGAPLSKLVIAAPVQAFQFTLQNEEYTAPGSPALELQSITRNELCKLMHAHKNWTLERDEDQAGPYIFSKNQWIAFEDSKSMDIKTKYSRVRGLAGIALKDLAQDGGSDCGSTILEAAYNGLSRQARAPRGAVLHSLEREIADSSAKTLDSVQLSPYRISRIIDTEGKIHIARQDSRTEFQCSRQGYFVHPRSCNRFYRCVKFDQHSDDYNVFEFDCPAGLAFDERVEVCVWPGSLPHGTPCSGSSEIAPVPRTRFVCPSEPGYYADPENCRWFFACLDHGKSPLSAYEFRCPFGLVFDGDRMVCEWSWLVPKCASSALGAGLDSGYYYGDGSGNGLGEGSLVLQNYDGLGTLGAIKLGGVAGKLEKPIATVYSNVGDGTLGLGYQNSGGYIEGGALSYKASQALQNAGLLKVNNGNQGTVYTYTGQAVDANGYLLHPGQYQPDGGKGAISTQSFTQYNRAGEYYAATDEQNNLDASDKGASFTQYHDQYGTNQGSGAAYVNAGGYEEVDVSKQHPSFINVGASSGYANVNAGGAISNQVFTQEQAKNIEHFGSGIAGSINIIGGGFSAVGPVSGGVPIPPLVESGNDVKIVSLTGAPGLVAATTGTKIASVPIVTAVPVPGIETVVGFQTLRGGVIANLPELQYKVKSSEDAAGLLNNFSTSFANFVVTPADDDGHSNFQGAGFVHGEASKAFDAVSISTARPFVGGQPDVYVSSTIKPLNQEHAKPSVSFQENSNLHNLQGISVDTYSTPKPTVIVEQQPHVVVSSTASPPVVSTYKPENTAIISKFTIRKPVQSAGSIRFDNEIPTVHLKQKTVVEDYTYQQPAVVSQYYYQQPVVNKEPPIPLYQQPDSLSTYTYQPPVQKQPVPTYTYQNVAAQATGVGYKQHEVGGTSYIQNQQGGHVYSKPSVVLEEKPQVAVVDNYQYSTPKPAVVVQEAFEETPVVTYSTPKPIENPAIVASYFNIDTSKSNNAPKPNTQFEETPVSVSSPKPFGAVANSYFNFASGKGNSQQQSGGYVYQKHQSVEVQPPQPAVVSSYFIGGDKSNLELEEQQQRVGYTNPKPSVAFEEAPRQPAVVTSYYNTPKPDVVQPVQYAYPKPAVVNSYFNFASSKANSEQQSGGYVYQKPETSVIYSTPQSVEVPPPQPAVASSYFNIGGGKTNFEESPVQPAVVTSYYSTPKPDVVQPVQYTYPQPEVKYSTPKPAVVNSYFNFASSKANSEQQSGGYVYQKPETSVIYSTPQSVEVQPPQPAVASSYFNIGGDKTNSEIEEQQQRVGYTNPKPSVAFEESPVQPAVVTSYYSTPKPDVVQPVQYTYPQPEVKYSTPKPAVVNSYFNFASSKANSEQQSSGYVYQKPETSVIYSIPQSVEVQPPQPAVTSSYFNIGGDKTNSEIEEQQQRVGYTNPKPSVAFEESPVQPAVVTSYYSTPKPDVVQPVQYTYPQPEVKYSTPKPAVVNSYFNFASSKTNSEQQSGGYVYQKPETSVIYSTPQSVEVQPPQPAIASSYFNIGGDKTNSEIEEQQQRVGYTNPKPSVAFEESPVQPAVVTSYYSTPKPDVVQPVLYTYPQPEVKYSTLKPAVVNSYFNFASSKTNSEQQSGGYVYQKPETSVIYSTPQSVEVQPPQPAVASSYFNIGGDKTNSEIEEQQQRVGYTYPKPSVAFEESPVQPAVVTSYYNTPQPNVVQEVRYSTPKSAVVSSYFNIGGDKTNSEIAFEESPVVTSSYNTPKPVEYTYPQPEVKYSTSKPAVVSSYSYIASTTPKPVVVEENAEETIGSTTPQQQHQVAFEATPKPALVTSYFHQQPSKGYEYPKPSIQFEDNPQPVQEVPFVKKTAYVTGQYQQQNFQQENYNYQQTGGKVVVETAQQPQIVIETTPKPALVTSYFHQQPSKGYEYPKPSIQFEDGPQPVQEVAYVTGQYQQQNFEENYNYQHDYQHTGGKVVVENYQYPGYEKVKQAVFGEKIYQGQQPQAPSTPRPTFARKKLQPVTIYDSRIYSSTPESYISSTIAPEVHHHIVSTTSRPISRYSFSSLDDQYQYNSTEEPVRAYLPATSTVKITSALPVTKTKVVEEYVAPEVRTTEYSPVYRTNAPVEVTTPSQVYLPTKEYLPSRRVKVTTEAPEITTLSREYLPARTRVKITTPGSSVEEKTYTIKPRRPITVIKQNDAHPLLSAKLGAQCTCVSSTLKLRKKQKIISVEDDDDDDDDGYVVDGKAVESYSYEPEKVIDITPTPQVAKNRPVYKKNTSVEDSAPSDKEIAKAVRTGLKLVKQAAKDGAKEGTQEVLSKHQFDRYGPGGVRSRSESLQGTIDCQRAGLFRHPTECNKFYACRWDCTKKRFTLHVFNCPVHLTFDNTLGACNWPSQGLACVENTLITSD